MSKLKLEDFFRVQTTEDDRGSTGGTVGFFTNSTDAKRAAQGQGYYGGEGRISPVKLTKIGDRYYLLDSSLPNGIGADEINIDLIADRQGKRAAAEEKAKELFTEEERKRLGLKF